LLILILSQAMNGGNAETSLGSGSKLFEPIHSYTPMSIVTDVVGILIDKSFKRS
jgi:hypothetical protein